MTRAEIALAALVIVFSASTVTAADKPMVLDLWPGQVPGQNSASGDEKITGNKGSRQLTNVSKPTITVYRPAKDKNTGVPIVVAPGGGYRILAWDHEGEDVAAWLNSIGITAAVLKYRVPVPPGTPRDDPSFAPHQDAQRAMSLVRSKAKDWNLDPNRIGMLGFSAGGHLTAMTETNFNQRGYSPIDDADKVSCRPDFAVVVYPGGVVARGTLNLTPAIRVSKDDPPTFIIQAGDDRVGAENSVALYSALKKAGVPAELHIYATGGHGFGLRPSKHPSSTWPKRCEEWLRDIGVLKSAAAQ